MTILLGTLLVLLAIAVVVWPFWIARHGPRRLEDPAIELSQALRRARDRVYEEIRVLQQEYFLKVLTEDDYRRQLDAARLRAAELLREQQHVEESLAAIGARVDAQLEGFLPSRWSGTDHKR